MKKNTIILFSSLILICCKNYDSNHTISRKLNAQIDSLANKTIKNYESNCNISEELIVQNDSLINEVLNSNYKEILTGYGENIITEQALETYRFQISQSLLPFLKIYRINVEPEKVTLTTKLYKRSNPYENKNDLLIEQSYRSLTEKEWSLISETLSKNCFWTIQSKDTRPVLDGVTWTLEGFQPLQNKYTKRNYHISFRNMPENSRFKNICQTIINLDTVDLKKLGEEYLDRNYPKKSR